MNPRSLIFRPALRLPSGGLFPLLVGVLFLASGCGPTPVVEGSVDVKDEKVVAKPADQGTLGMVAELLRRQADFAHCREALQMVNGHLNTDSEARSEASQETTDPRLLRNTLHLTDEEISYLGQPSFTELDAYHLDLCYRLRGVIAALRLRTLSPEVQARQGFDWAMRQMVLDQENRFVLPPELSLKRGRGTAQDRALVFLALMQQLELPACMVVITDDTEATKHYWLPGVLIKAKSEKGKKAKPGAGKEAIHLFDTRLSLPLPATLEQLRSQPKLLDNLAAGKQKYDVTPEQIAHAQVCLVFTLPALSPRMHYLERELRKKTPIVLAQTPAELLARFEAVEGKGKVLVWNEPARPGQPPPNSPLRALRPFLSPDQGGTGRPDLMESFEKSLIPETAIKRQYLAMRVYHYLQLPDPQRRLWELTNQMYTQYAVQPHDELTRGHLDQELTRPLIRIVRVLKAFHQLLAARTREEKEEMIKDWAANVSNMNMAAAQKARGAEAQYAKLWSEDQFLAQLLSSGTEEVDLRPDLKKTALTYIILEALDELLTDESHYLLARSWQEKAFRAQYRVAILRLEGKSVPESKLKEAAQNWPRTEDWARRFLQAHALAPEAIHDRLDNLARELPNHPLGLVLQENLWEEFFKNLHRAVALRLHQADGLALAGKTEEAAQKWQSLKGDLEKLLANAELRKSLKDFQDKLEARPVRGQDSLALHLKHTAAALDPGGSLHWYLHAVTLRLEKKKS
jgi:hypothetical protein